MPTPHPHHAISAPRSRPTTRLSTSNGFGRSSKLKFKTMFEKYLQIPRSSELLHVVKMKSGAFALASVLSVVHAAPSSFSCAVSTVTLHAGQPALTVCDHTAAPGSGGGFASQHWMTGTNVAGPYAVDDVLIEIFIDGEASPSVKLYPYQVRC